MKRYFLVVLIFALSALVMETNAETKAPTFEQYQVVNQFKGRPVQVDLKSASGASRFRTVLRRGAKKGPNFAGHFMIIEWGCGTGCASVAVIDATSGRVMFPKEFNPVSFPGRPEGDSLRLRYGLVYRKDSSLLIVHGIPSAQAKEGSYYYLLKNGQFSLVFTQEWEINSKP